MDLARAFSASYAEARQRFVAAADTAGAAVESIQHPLRGPDGGKLYTDIAWLGARDAPSVLLTISATHGVEGYCGSGCQAAFFMEGASLHRGTALMAVHAINPHGFAWTRRVTEDNVDLNRNFQDHAAGDYPANPGHAELADAIAPREWTEAARAAAQAKLDDYARRHGPAALNVAMMGGQYTRPDGIYFGGHAPTWSNRLLMRLWREHLAQRRAVAVVDYHTGLGPFGYGEPIAPYAPDSAAFRDTRAALGDELTSPELGSSVSVPVRGTNLEALRRAGGPAFFAAIALEFGTQPPDEVFGALRADNWLHWHGDPNSAQGAEIKAAMRRAFYPEDEVWCVRVARRAISLNRRFQDALAQA